MRKLIAGMKISADEKVNTDDGDGDWVEGWCSIRFRNWFRHSRTGCRPALSKTN
jgi:hypothetical protein